MSWKKFSILFAFNISMCSFPCDAQNGWFMASGDRERTSWVKNETSLAPPFTQRDLLSPIAGMHASFITCAQGTLYIADDGGSTCRLIACEAATGKHQWTFDIPNSGGSIGVCPAISGSTVIIGGQDATHLHALNRNDGSVLWTKPVGSTYTRNPIIDQDRVYVRTDSLYCLDLADGKTLWSYPMIDREQGSPAVDESHVYVAYHDSLFAFDKISGGVRWVIAKGKPEALAVDDASVYNSINGKIRAVNKINGAVQWTHNIPDGMSAAWIDGNAFAIDNERVVYVVWENKDTLGVITALNKFNGNLLWSKALHRGIYSPTIANGIVYTTTWIKPWMWALDVRTGEVKYIDSSRRFENQVVIVDGKCFASVSGGVYRMSNAPISIEPQLPPKEFTLEQNYPNPFAQSTAIGYRLPASGHVRLEVFDVFGRKLATLVDAFEEAGEHGVKFDIQNYSPAHPRSNVTLYSGVLIYRLKTNDRATTRKMIIAP